MGLIGFLIIYNDTFVTERYMKRIKNIFGVLIGTMLLSSCSSELLNINEDGPVTRSILPSEKFGEEMILGAHKCNEIVKLQDAVDYGISNFEVDIHVSRDSGTPVLMIGHELETSTGQTFEAYMDDLLAMKPDFNFLWLDFKDLSTDENEAIIRETLYRLDSKYNIKHRVLVESRYITHLTSFANDGWHVSFYSTWSSLVGKTAAQQKEICDGWLQSMQENNVDGISFDSDVCEAMKTNFANAQVNNRPVKQYAWNYRIYFNEPNIQEKLKQYSHLAVIIIGFPNEEIPKLVMDIQFAENGIATNMGNPISSLPAVQRTTNAIETRWNTLYGKYEALFDGTNFYYVPYGKNDAVGNAMKGMFSMEILFSPTGGVNQFSSMESGGLGYEITSDNKLAFYYRANNKWVLPNNNFQTPIQLGQDVYYHAVVTYNKTTAKMYLNGNKVKEVKVSGTFNFPKKDVAPDYLMGIGGDYRDSATPSIQNTFIGKIVYAKLYKGVLSDSDIKGVNY